MTKEFGVFDCIYRENFRNYSWKMFDTDNTETVAQGLLIAGTSPFNFKSDPILEKFLKSTDTVTRVLEEIRTKTAELSKDYNETAKIISEQQRELDRKNLTKTILEDGKRIIYQVEDGEFNKLKVYIGFNQNKIVRIVIVSKKAYINPKSEYSSAQWFQEGEFKMGLFHIEGEVYQF